MADIDSRVFFVTLESKPQLYLVFYSGADRIRLGASEFRLVDSEAGFYDFLRDRKKEIIGVRFSPFAHQPIVDYALPLNYTYVEKARGYMEIYFRGHKGLSVPGIAEQSFGDDAVWRNEVGVYALQVGTNDLTQGEIDSLKRISVTP